MGLGDEPLFFLKEKIRVGFIEVGLWAAGEKGESVQATVNRNQFTKTLGCDTSTHSYSNGGGVNVTDVDYREYKEISLALFPISMRSTAGYARCGCIVSGMLMLLLS